MMDVRIVRVSVDKFLVPVPVRVWFAGRVVRSMSVLMMFIVSVRVLVFHRLVPVFMLVTFSEMKPDTQRHEDGGGNEANGQRVP